MELISDEPGASFYANLSKTKNRLDISKSKPKTFKFGKFIDKENESRLLSNQELTIAVFRVAIGRSFVQKIFSKDDYPQEQPDQFDSINLRTLTEADKVKE